MDKKPNLKERKKAGPKSSQRKRFTRRKRAGKPREVSQTPQGSISPLNSLPQLIGSSNDSPCILSPNALPVDNSAVTDSAPWNLMTSQNTTPGFSQVSYNNSSTPPFEPPSGFIEGLNISSSALSPVDNSAVTDSTPQDSITPQNLTPRFSEVCNVSASTPLPDPTLGFIGGLNISTPSFRPSVHHSAVTDPSCCSTSSSVHVGPIVSPAMEVHIARSGKFSSMVTVKKDGEHSLVPPTKPSTPAVEQDVWETARAHIALMLPSNWDLIFKQNGFHVVRTSRGEGLVIQRSLFVALDGHISAWVHGKRLLADHLFWKSVREVKLSAESTVEFSENVLQLVSTLRSYEICRGVMDFEDVWKYFPTAEIDLNRFQEKLYEKTCRSAECHMLVNSVKVRRCVKCASLWRSVSSRYKAFSTKIPAKTTPFISMSSPQKMEAFKRIQRENHAVKMMNRRLKVKLAEMIRKEGLEVEDDFAKRLKVLLDTDEA